MAIVAYHASDASFNKFSFDFAGESNGLDAGFGMYFTTVAEDSHEYGDIMYTVIIDKLQNDLSNETVTVPDHKWQSIIKTLGVNQNLRDLTMSIEGNISDVEILRQLIFLCDELNIGTIGDVLSVIASYGYSHAIDMVTPQNKPELNAIHYIIFDLDTIKIIDKQRL